MKTLQRLVVVASLLVGGVGFSACLDELPDWLHRASTPPPQPVDAAAPLPTGCLSLEPAREVGGEKRWPWRLRWSSEGQDSLAEVCARTGPDALVKMTPGYPGPAGWIELLLEAPCTDGELVAYLPTKVVIHGLAQVASAATGKTSAQVRLNQDVHCSRDVHFTLPQN